MKLTLNEILQLCNSLPKLKACKLDGSTQWNLAKNIKALAKEQEQWNELRSEKILELSPEHKDLAKEDPAKKEEFVEWATGMAGNETEVAGLLMLKRSRLLANDNQVPDLEALFPIIEDDGEGAAK